MSNQPNKTNGAKPAVRKKKNLLDDRRVRLALSVLCLLYTSPSPRDTR